MKFKYGLGIYLACGLAQSTLAAEFSYTTLELGYQSADVSLFGQDRNFTGYALSGRYQLDHAAYIFARADQMTNSDFDFEPSVESLEIGVGGFAPISRNSDLFFGVGYGRYNVEFGQLIDSELDGFSLKGGIRTRLTQNVELEGTVNNLHLDGQTDTVASLAGRYYLTALVSPEIIVSRADDVQTVSLGLQFRF